MFHLFGGSNRAEVEELVATAAATPMLPPPTADVAERQVRLCDGAEGRSQGFNIQLIFGMN